MPTPAQVGYRPGRGDDGGDVILVCGATGELGGRVARRLAERGQTFRALVRAGSAHAARDVAAPTVVGDFRDPDSLERAVEGVDTVVSTVTAIGRILAGERATSLAAVDRDGYRALIDAAERAGVRRFVFVSAANFRREPGASTVMAAAKNATEDRLAASPLREVVIRPDMYHETWLAPPTQFDWPRRRVVVFGRGETPARYVAVDDVAELVTQLALDEDAPRLVEVGGPDPLTRKQAVEVFERALGEPIKRRHIPRAVLRVGTRALAPVRPVQASLMGLALNADLYPATWGDTPLRERGIDPRTVEEYAAAVTRTTP